MGQKVFQSYYWISEYPWLESRDVSYSTLPAYFVFLYQGALVRQKLHDLHLTQVTDHKRPSLAQVFDQRWCPTKVPIKRTWRTCRTWRTVHLYKSICAVPPEVRWEWMAQIDLDRDTMTWDSAKGALQPRDEIDQWDASCWAELSSPQAMERIVGEREESCKKWTIEKWEMFGGRLDWFGWRLQQLPFTPLSYFHQQQKSMESSQHFSARIRFHLPSFKYMHEWFPGTPWFDDAVHFQLA